jgi:iron complex outermembrane receptor protein
MRFAMGSFVSLANTDFSHDSYGSTDSSYLVFDAKVQYKFAPDWTATAGINNIGNNKALVNPNPIRSAPSSLVSDTTSAARRSSKP